MAGPKCPTMSLMGVPQKVKMGEREVREASLVTYVVVLCGITIEKKGGAKIPGKKRRRAEAVEDRSPKLRAATGERGCHAP